MFPEAGALAMVAINTTLAKQPYSSHGAYTAISARTVATAPRPQASAGAANEVTISEAARAALAERDLASVLADARSKLDTLLKDAGRTSPLEGSKLALDLSTLDHRELYAVAGDEAFAPDQRDAAGLEMQRRFEAALAGPAAIAEVTGSYTNLYRAAAAYLDALGPEERASADWKAGRDAVTEGLRQLASAPGTLPDAGDADPVALYLALAEAGQAAEPVSMEALAKNVRASLDQLYAQARANGRAPSFNRNTTTGTFIDVSAFSSRALSAMVLNTENKFSPEEANAARAALRSKSSATLVAGVQSATASGDPTAFSQNILAAFRSLSAEERQAVGWSDQLYQAAMQSYTSTSKLMDMLGQITPSASPGGLASFLSR
jgi:hypothetical protein